MGSSSLPLVSESNVGCRSFEGSYLFVTVHISVPVTVMHGKCTFLCDPCVAMSYPHLGLSLKKEQAVPVPTGTSAVLLRMASSLPAER
jgi:hypothetical protein